MYNDFKKYSVKKIVRRFSDLDIYQKTLDASVVVIKNLKPALARIKYIYAENLVNRAGGLPMIIAEAHSIRFGDHSKGVALLERAMADCNIMVVFLEQAKGVCGAKIDGDLMDDLISRYTEVRTKIFHLEKSWQKWYEPKK